MDFSMRQASSSARRQRYARVAHSLSRHTQSDNDSLDGLSSPGVHNGYVEINDQTPPPVVSLKISPQNTESRIEWFRPFSDDLKGLKVLLLSSLKFNILFIFCPIGMFCGWFYSNNAGLCFLTNFLALLPLAKILGDATEEVSAGIRNETIGGLLNATFGNLVEMIITIQTLYARLLSVVKGALLGSILSNLLLVLGMSFFAGGIGRKGKEQVFKETGPMVNMSMLLLSCVGFALPTVFFSVSKSIIEHEHDPTIDLNDLVLNISRVTSGFLLSSYIAYLLFQLYTHMEMFEEQGEGEEDDCSISVTGSMVLLGISTILVAINSEFLVNSIEGVVYDWGISPSFIGIIILPIVGNACEHASAIRMCLANKPVIAIGIAVGSSTQIALLVVPFAVLFGWYIDVPMDLNLQTMNVVILVLSVIITMSIIVDGKSNWLEGWMLQVTYILISIVFWYDPDTSFGSMRP